MKNIQGRVKHDILNELFKLGDLNHPDTVTKEITDTMKAYNNKMSKPSSIRSAFGLFPKSTYKPFTSASDFIYALRNKTISEVSLHFNDEYFISLWYKIQDIRVVLEVKCVAKNCQSNNIMADKNSLLALQRVVDNKEEYLAL